MNRLRESRLSLSKALMQDRTRAKLLHTSFCSRHSQQHQHQLAVGQFMATMTATVYRDTEIREIKDYSWQIRQTHLFKILKSIWNDEIETIEINVAQHEENEKCNNINCCVAFVKCNQQQEASTLAALKAGGSRQQEGSSSSLALCTIQINLNYA